MSPLGNKQRLCYGAWVAAAVILAGINALGFLTLEGQALEGYSPVIKSLQVNLNRLQNVLSVQKSIDYGRDDIQHVLSTYQLHPKTPSLQADAAPQKTQPSKKIVKQLELPDLGGILQVADKNGVHWYLALLDGKACRPNDQVMEFVVKKISAHGVVLARAGKSWFIKTPNIYYSSDQGE